MWLAAYFNDNYLLFLSDPKLDIIITALALAFKRNSIVGIDALINSGLSLFRY